MKSIVDIFETLMGLVGVGAFLLIVFNFSINVCREFLNIKYKYIMKKQNSRRYIMRKVVTNSIIRLVIGTGVVAVEYIAYRYIFEKIYACINVESVNLTIVLASLSGLMIMTVVALVIMVGTCKRLSVYNKVYDRAYKNTDGKVESMWI